MTTIPSTIPALLAFWSPGPGEMLLLVLVALLLYGGNLPEVARTWGKTLAEFRRSLSGIQNEFNEAIYSEPERLEYRDDSYSYDGYVEETSVSDSADATLASPESDAAEKVAKPDPSD